MQINKKEFTLRNLNINQGKNIFLPCHLRHISFIFLLLVIFYSTAAKAQFSAEVKAKNDSTYLVGDRIEVKIITKHPNNYKVQWPAPDLKQSKLELLDSIVTDSSVKANEIITTQTWHVTAFDSGEFYFPSLAFTFTKNGDTTRYLVNSDSVLLKINTLALDTTSTIKPIKPPVEIPYTFKELLPWISGGLALLAAIVLIIYFLRRRKKKTVEEAAPMIPPKPAYEEAREALEKLKQEQAWQMQESKIYYTILSDIIRRYISRRWNVEAMEHTTDEIIDEAEKAGVKGEVLQNLRQLLQEADLAKFAKAIPGEEMRYNNFIQAEKFVENTRPAIVLSAETNTNPAV